MRKKKRGQAAVTDLFIAISVFIILTTIATLTWNLYNLRLQNRLDYDSMMMKGFQISETLVKNQGNPLDWEKQGNINDIQVIGLSNYERILSKDKVDRFMQLQPEEIKQLLKIGTHDFYFVLREVNGTIIVGSGGVDYRKGKFPAGNFAVNLARFVIFEGEPTILEFAVWK